MPYIDVELGLQRNIEEALLDTGATYNTMSYETWTKLKGYELQETDMEFTGFSGEVSAAYGMCTVDMFLNNINCVYKFYVLQPHLETIQVILGQAWQVKHDAVCEWRKRGVRCEVNGQNFLVPFRRQYLPATLVNYDQNAPEETGAEKYKKIAKVDEQEEALRKEAEKKRLAKGKDKLEENYEEVQPVLTVAKKEKPPPTTSSSQPKDQPPTKKKATKPQPMIHNTKKHARRQAIPHNKALQGGRTYKWVPKHELAQNSNQKNAGLIRGPKQQNRQQPIQGNKIWLPKRLVDAQRYMDTIWVPKRILNANTLKSNGFTTKATKKKGLKERKEPKLKQGPTSKTHGVHHTQIWIPKALADAQRYTSTIWVPRQALKAKTIEKQKKPRQVYRWLPKKTQPSTQMERLEMSYKWVRKAQKIRVPPTIATTKKTSMVWQRKAKHSEKEQIKDQPKKELTKGLSIAERARKLQVLLFGHKSLQIGRISSPAAADTLGPHCPKTSSHTAYLIHALI